MPGTVIKRYREVKNFSQKYVAAKMGISQNAYSKIENNITQLTVQHVKELSNILEVPITDLLKDDFEIHRPAAVPHSVSKSDLLKKVEVLYNKIESKHAGRHHCYVVAMSLVVTADGALDPVH
ncbi:MAG TPA: helix-turn-helix transcriptional regulator [Chitinophagaceae bacterium]|nr:helix-turn-helix transcriptional regulator [Chitinophagaceae bacterium]